MYQMPIEIIPSTIDTRVVEIKQQLVMHNPEDFVSVMVSIEQIPELIKSLQAHIPKKERRAAAAPSAEHFETHFWSLYPSCKRKVDRSGCLKIWTQKNLDEKAEEIAAAVSRFACDPEATKNNGEFVPMPATWLRQSRWEAEDAARVDTTWNKVI